MSPVDASSALVLFSGGQDSTTCLAWALSRYERVETIGFPYGQRHAVEMEMREPVRRGLAGLSSDWARRLGPDHVVPLDVLGRVSVSALTADLPMATRADGLPSTFVPGRNLVFLSFAAAFAYTRGIEHVVTGVAQTDYSGYPDCRENTLKALELALRLGMDSRVTLHAPLMFMSKADTVRLAQDVGAMDAMAWSHTCYNGEVPPCGRCASCELRAKGFAEAGVADPLVVRTGGAA